MSRVLLFIVASSHMSQFPRQINILRGNARRVLLAFYAQENAMAKAARAAPKTRNGKPRKAAERGVKSNAGRIHRLAAAERDAKIKPALRELSHLSAERAAAELERRGFGWMSYVTVHRARARLGLPSRRTVNEEIAAE
jgi:hypothetical protein